MRWTNVIDRRSYTICRGFEYCKSIEYRTRSYQSRLVEAILPANWHIHSWGNLGWIDMKVHIHLCCSRASIDELPLAKLSGVRTRNNNRTNHLAKQQWFSCCFIQGGPYDRLIDHSCEIITGNNFYHLSASLLRGQTLVLGEANLAVGLISPLGHIPVVAEGPPDSSSLR
jgi:hypothetical protein